ncbi:MAG TPA: ABC transporter ATP-binding protein, partial [Flavitalea sp.]|nr:ABC transporter ATP-binding protein [Flavitalea sp.]
VSFSVNEGEIYGLLGQNGAGKSTLIRMLLSLVTPTSGSIRIFGRELKKDRKKILQQTGAIIEKPDLYKYLTASENLVVFAKMHGIRLSGAQVKEKLAVVGLTERSESKIKTYSQGMKQRLGLAVALVNNPRLIILDEPTNGLDPQGIADVRNLILHLSRFEKRTIVISSHLLSEMEVLADRMMILDKGSKVMEGSLRQLLDPSVMNVKCEISNAVEISPLLKTSRWKAHLKDGGTDFLLFELPSEDIPLLVKDLIEMEAKIMSIQQKHSLEDYFLSLTTANQHVDTFTNRVI